MAHCELYDPDNVFKRFQLLEFPMSFVGLSTQLELKFGMDITGSCYLRTMYHDKLLKFDDARELSAAHRAFTITILDKETIRITFKPLNECISRVRRLKKYENRFVFDLRLIKADGLQCCYDEYHSEVGRYYISGQYEYCDIAHSPEIVNFGDVLVKSKVSKAIRIRNHSPHLTAKMTYMKTTDVEVTPQQFKVPANSSKRIIITLQPHSLNTTNKLVFRIRNPHDPCTEPTIYVTKDVTDTNFLTYYVTIQANVCYGKVRTVKVESLHTIYEPHPHNTYLGEELTIHNERKIKADQIFKTTCYMLHATSKHVKPFKEKYCTGTVRCYSHTLSITEPRRKGINFCKEFVPKAKAPDLFHIRFLPLLINFGQVGLDTFGEQSISIENKTEYNIAIRFLRDEYVLYSKNKLACYTIKLSSHQITTLTILCLGMAIGDHCGTFKYAIDNEFFREHRYCLQVANSLLYVPETTLKFGMVTSESFTSSVPVRVHNNFNISVDYEWSDIQEAPYEIVPRSGTIPEHDCRICDITYIPKPTKSKTHIIELQSKGQEPEVVPLETIIMTRKMTVKFLQNLILFKDIPLNLEVRESIRLENSSREIALFYVIEPLLPGFTVNPMNGVLQPKTVINLIIVAKIPCILEFTFDLLVKVNNKENIGVTINGNVIDPKLSIYPKNIIVPRIPCGLITYIPVTLQNTGSVKCDIEVMDTGDENIFNVYVPDGNERRRIHKFSVEAGQSKIIFVKIYDVFRREYDMYVPLKINGLLGPPNHTCDSSSELKYYIQQYENDYSNTLKAKVKTINKDISYCRIAGVITVPWILFSVEKFEIDYVPNGSNRLHFTMTNVSKYYLYIAIITAKLTPNFSLTLEAVESESFANENNIKFELDRGREASLCMNFHPKGPGRYATVAFFYLDKAMSVPYSNLTFIGRNQRPAMTSSTNQIIFPPCPAGKELTRTLTLEYYEEAILDRFTCSSKEEPHIRVNFIECQNLKVIDEIHALVTVTITVYSKKPYSRNMALLFHHEGGSVCNIEVNFCFTHCPLTLHTYTVVTPEESSYPYFPSCDQTELYEYMETCRIFLERWMFQQGFRRDMYPEIPYTFYAISTAITSAPIKTKSISLSYLSFMKKIAGPLLKHRHKSPLVTLEDPYKAIHETHNTYREIIRLLRSRGEVLWHLQARYLLTHDQFILYSQLEPKINADNLHTEKLINDQSLFHRLSTQSWIDLILQSYKVFVLDSCFFECTCLSSQSKDIVKALVDWYNEQILIARYAFFDNTKSLKVVENITTDLQDGVAITASIVNHCPFLEEHFSIMCEVNKDNPETAIVHNACLIIEAMSILRLNFPLTSQDLLQPNFLQMLFLSIHLYVSLPMFKPKATIAFSPPLLRSSTRQVTINPMSQETLLYTCVIIGNSKNCFIVEKAPNAGDNGKKMCMSVKYTANFVSTQTAILIVHGYNKTRIFDTYILFNLVGSIGALHPHRKCKLSAPLYRPNRVDVSVYSPFVTTACYTIHLTDVEPTIPVSYETSHKKGFYIRRLNLMDNEITLNGLQKESNIIDFPEHKVYLQMHCLSSQIAYSWIWFRSEVGDFFVKVTTQPRTDFAVETLQVTVDKWPMDPCSCGEACECYRSAVLMIPHRNELMLKALRYALCDNASKVMMNIFDQLIDSTTGQIILIMLLAEGGTNLLEVRHILRPETTYRISSKTLAPRMDRVTFKQHTDAILALPVTLPPCQKSEKFSITFTSECGMDLRTYRILFMDERISTEKSDL